MHFSLESFRSRREAGEKIVMLTCYDASFASLCEDAGVEILLIGDSLGMVVQGHDSTLPVTMDEMEYHVRSVARGSRSALLLADLPFATYQASPGQAYLNAARLMAAGAQAVKLEGGQSMTDTVRFLVHRGIPVCGHIGLLPQSVHQLGGYRPQGNTELSARRLLDDAIAIEAAGAGMVVLEAIPATLAKEITASISIPTIGIGAGSDCSGQVLVLYDMLDIYPGKKPRFVRNFMAGTPGVSAAIRSYVQAVRSRTFPAPEHAF